ncbi:MAG: translation initiation factor IF-2 [Victivallaceae bacterium]|nr:translation initiation factor IF-2 [Victivallaceae bacterium]
MKKVKIKDIAKKYGISPKKILEELESEGIELESTSSPIPPDMVELLEMHFEEIFSKSAKSRSAAFAAARLPAAAEEREIHLKTPIIVKQLAEALGKKPNEIISALMKIGELASINQSLSEDIAEKVGKEFGAKLIIDHRTKDEHTIHGGEGVLFDDTPDKPENLRERPPIVTFLGHVDHGKTSLQDKIRNTMVAAVEAGKITQHIGASQVTFNGHKITFIDTPGHEAFTRMRARGANVTDIAVLVVAADDGFMPQTIEALNHAQAAKVPVIVAINKIDLPDANPEKILLQMQQNGLMSEDWGGEVGTVRVSALTGEGLDNLLERILLEAEILELKANPDKPAKALVLESRLEAGLGATASVLVQEGTLKVGDIIVADEYYGRVKSLFDDHGSRVAAAGPSTPVKLVGLSGAPEAGSKLGVCKRERDARNESERRAHLARQENLAKGAAVSVEDLFSRINRENKQTLNIIIKSDVRGSGEAIQDSLSKLPSDKIEVNVIMNGVGAITENDITLAAASNAIVVGFHVKVNPGINDLAKKTGVEIRLYSIIYELLDDITAALTGRLEPEKREKDLGEARILQIFEVKKGINVIGCMIEKGLVKTGAKARVYRNNQLIYNGEVTSLRRFQDAVKEVKAGLECGIKLDNFVDFEQGDVVKFFEIELQQAKL